MSAEQRLVDLGITLPAPSAAAGLYAPVMRTGPLLYVSGQLPLRDGQPVSKGHCGQNVSLEEAADLARICTLNALALVREHLGTLDRVAKVVRVGGFVASAPGFIAQPQVINGASQLLVDVFGEAGKHARVAVGVAELPLGVPVEVEYLFEVRPA